eukprot:SAG11_NODE_16041_length_558_cov_1.455338_1_plen_52_part_10
MGVAEKQATEDQRQRSERPAMMPTLTATLSVVSVDEHHIVDPNHPWLSHRQC